MTSFPLKDSDNFFKMTIEGPSGMISASPFGPVTEQTAYPFSLVIVEKQSPIQKEDRHFLCHVTSLRDLDRMTRCKRIGEGSIRKSIS